jgi:catechol 2,3-dioxygenase-like lactoylglutathione lyase family enzyme
MSRIQLALNVDDLDQAVTFYSRLFDAAPAKRRPGYANFALDEPAVKLVLIENPGRGGTLNHLGVEVASTEEVVAATRRYAAAGMPTEVEDGTTCCYALQDKVWVSGPGGERWEVYTVLADAGAELESRSSADVDPATVTASATVTAPTTRTADAPRDRSGACCAG